MSAKTFEPGAQWRMRGGVIATINHHSLAGSVTATWGNRYSIFTLEGRYWYHDCESEFDLMEPISAKPAHAKLKRYSHRQIGIDGTETRVLIEVFSGGCGGVGEADAVEDRIVLAWNSHDRLVNGLRKIARTNGSAAVAAQLTLQLAGIDVDGSATDPSC